MNRFDTFEQKINYFFKDKEILFRCFTHSSFSNENKKLQSNERFEFLGDAILGFIVSDYLFNKYSASSEGDLTVKKQKIVSKIPLSQATKKHGFDKYIIVGGGAKNSNISNSLCENLFESIVAGIYLDGGFQACKKFVYDFLLNEADALLINEIDYKGKLQEIVQKYKLGDITYKIVEVKGPDHAPSFVAQVYVNSEMLGIGEGSSKQKAEKASALVAINKLQSVRK